MKKTQLIIINLIIFLLTACTKKPSASFTADKTTVKVGETVTFANASKNGQIYYWEFGDGTTSQTRYPSHIYKNSGSYNVTLTVSTNDKKKSSNTSTIITVDDEAFQFSAVFRSKQKTFVVDDVNFESLTSNSVSIGASLYEYELEYGILKKSNTSLPLPSIRIYIGKLAFSNITSIEQRYNNFANLISVKSFPFSKYTNGNLSNGVRIEYTEEDGTVWATDVGGSGNQDGSNFTIVSAKYVKPELDAPYILFKATFNAKLYSFGAVTNLSNGILVGVFKFP